MLYIRYQWILKHIATAANCIFTAAAGHFGPALASPSPFGRRINAELIGER